MDEFGTLRKAGQVAGHPVIEAKAQTDDEIGLLDRAIDVDLAMHPGHAEVERVRLGEPADAQQRGDHRDSGTLGQYPELRVRAREHDAMPGHDEWTLRVC